LKLRGFDAVLHNGDLGYDLNDYNGRVGDIFGRISEPIAANFPYMTVPGNHEDHSNATHYKARYNMPETEENQGMDTFYSFNLGAAHYIMFDTETYTFHHEGSEGARQTQNNWLREDLKKANEERSVRPWIIAVSHHPLYCSVDWHKPLDGMLGSNANCGVDSLKFQEILEDLFYENGVDVFF
jgi:hypothetical protein